METFQIPTAIAGDGATLAGVHARECNDCRAIVRFDGWLDHCQFHYNLDALQARIVVLEKGSR